MTGMGTAPTGWSDLRLRFMTPAFLGDPGVGPHLFPVASLRGVLRYWLRALIGAHLGNDLRQLAVAESAVFGGAAGGDGVPSKILLRAVRRIPFTDPSGPNWMPSGRDGAPFVRYLLGPGLYDPDSKQISRPFVAPGTDVHLRLRNLGGSAHMTLFLASLWALSTFGGIGARVRRGFGTVALLDPDGGGLAHSPRWLRQSDEAALPQVLADVADALANLPKDERTVLAARDHDDRPRYPFFDPARPPHWHLVQQEELAGGGLDSVGTALAAVGEMLRKFRVGDRRFDDREPGEDYETVIAPYLDHGRPPAGDDASEPGYIFGAALGLPVTFSDPAPGGSGRRSAVVEPVTSADEGRPRQATPPTPAMPPRPGPSPLMLARQGPRRESGDVTLRRASPLWLRVHHSRHGWRLRSLAFLAEWLPEKATLRLTDTTKPEVRSHQRRRPVTVPRLSAELVDNELREWFPEAQ